MDTHQHEAKKTDEELAAAAKEQNEQPENPEKPKKPDEAADAAKTDETTAATLEALRLDADATPEEYLARLAEVVDAADSAAKLGEELAAANARIAELEGAAKASQIDSLFDGHDLDEATAAPLREMAATNPEGVKLILDRMAAGKAAAPAAPDTTLPKPPAPVHDPAATDDEAEQEELAARIAAKARDLIESNPRLAWADAELQAARILHAPPAQ